MSEQSKKQSSLFEVGKFIVFGLVLFVWIVFSLANGEPNISYSQGATIPTPTPLPSTTFSIGDVSVLESDGSAIAEFKVTRSNNLEKVSVLVNTVNKEAFGGADFVSLENELVQFHVGGGLTKKVSVTILGDTKVEGDERFEVVLSNPINALLGKSVGEGVILNDDTATVTLSLIDSEKNEGDIGVTDFKLSVALDNQVSSGFDIAYKTVADTATSDVDYVAVDSKLSFSGFAGESKEITIQVKGDKLVEGDETFSVELGEFSDTNKEDFLFIADSPQKLIIIDDEEAVLTLTGGTAKEEGNDGTVEYTFTATLSEEVSSGFEIKYFTNDDSAQVANNDYVDNDGVWKFEGLAGETMTAIVIVNGDEIGEANEVFEFELGEIEGLENPEGLIIEDNPQFGIILNDDEGVFFIDVGVAETTRSEFDATIPVSVTFSGQLGITATVDYATSAISAEAGVDYTDVSGTLVFGPGDKTKVVNVPIIDDDIEEENESFAFQLSNPTEYEIGNPSLVGLTIIDDEGAATVELGQSIINGVESDESVEFEVKLSKAIALPVTVKIATQNGTAKSGSDFTGLNQVVTFEPGTISQTITIDFIDDEIYERSEDFTLLLSDIQNAELGEKIEALVKIEEDELAPTISITGATQTEAVAGDTMMVFELELSHFAAVDIYIDFATEDGSAKGGEDYEATSGQLRIRAGSRKGTIGVVIFQDAIQESDETFTLKLLSSSEGTIDGTNSAVDVTGTIQDTQATDIYLPIVPR